MKDADCGCGAYELCGVPLRGCVYDVSLHVWSYATRVLRCIDSRTWPAAGGLQDQGEQFRQAHEIVLGAKNEIRHTLEEAQRKKHEREMRRAKRR